MNKPRILVVGTAGIELNADISCIPALSHTQYEDDGYEYLPGGIGALSAHCINRLGAESVLCSKLGNDTYGSKLHSIYESCGINTRFITTDNATRTSLNINLNEQTHARRTISYRGASAKVSASDIEDALTCYPDAVLLHFDVPEDTLLFTVKAARNSENVPLIIVDATPIIPEFPLEALGEIDVFLCNEDEALAYTGIKTNTLDSCLKACFALSSKVQANYFIIKLGDRGVFLYDGTYYRLISEYNVEVENDYGASDIFTAAFAVEYLRSYNTRRACEFANVAVAYARSKKGYFDAVPSETELKDFIISNNINYHMDTVSTNED